MTAIKKLLLLLLDDEVIYECRCILHSYGSGNVIRLSRPSKMFRRGKNYLLIWPERPYWIACDEEIMFLFKNFGHAKDKDSLYDEYTQIYPGKTPSFKDFSKMIEHLEKKGLISKGDSPPPHSSDKIENVTINITNKCNLSCLHCYNQDIPHGEDIIEPEDVERLLSSLEHKLKDGGSFAILGGEPLLRADETLEACLIARRYGLDPIISTNGTILPDGYPKKLRRHSINLQVSLDGATPATNDEIRGKGVFRTVEKNVKLLTKKKVHVILSMVVCQENIHELEDFLYLGEKWGVKEVRFIPLKLIGKGQEDNLTPPSFKELVRRAAMFLSNNKKYQKYLLRDFFTILMWQCIVCKHSEYCGMGSKTLFMDSDGGLYPCPNMCDEKFLFGNIRNKRNLEKVWHESDVLLDIRETCNVHTMNPKCSNCAVRNWCAGGCRGETYHVLGNLYEPSPMCKNYKEAIIETMWLLAEHPHIKPKKAKEEHF